MKDNDTVCLVRGYHSTTPHSKKAMKAGLETRFALILNTYHPDFDYMYFQSDLFIEVLHQVKEVLDQDTIAIEVNDDIEYQSIEDFEEYLFSTQEEDRLPPQRIYFRKKGKLVCLEETEFWNLCGGDLPYSDSFTISFYTTNDMADSLKKACFTACESKGKKDVEIIQASNQPIKPNLLSKLFRYKREI